MTTGYIVFLITVNTLAWLVIHLGFAWAGTRLSADRFDPADALYRPRWFEKNGKIYERVFGVRRWKDLMPDGAAWFRGGFRKAGLSTMKNDYLARFIVETCRGEFVHWMVFAAGFLFFLWNTVAIGLVMVLYAAIANVPCIVIQRYNRIRLQQILNRRKRRD